MWGQRSGGSFLSVLLEAGRVLLGTPCWAAATSRWTATSTEEGEDTRAAKQRGGGSLWWTRRDSRVKLLRDIESAARLADPGPHVVAVVVKIGQLSATDSRALTLLTELLEGAASRHAAVLFTHGDALGDRPLQDAIRSSRRVSDLVSRCRGRHCVLDNTRSGERAQVERFLRLVDDIIRENDGHHWSRDALRSGDLEDTSCSNNVVEHALAARTPPSLLSVCWRLLCLSALFVRRHFHWI